MHYSSAHRLIKAIVCQPHRLHLKNYFNQTEQVPVTWIKQSIFFHDKNHPMKTYSDETEAFSTYLALDYNVTASTQNQVIYAILVLDQE